MTFTPMKELLNEPEEQTRWLVEDHLPAGGNSLLVAKPKVGKSTLARSRLLEAKIFSARKRRRGRCFISLWKRNAVR
jgi:hypothetical protein